jgi:hypothetical protein
VEEVMIKLSDAFKLQSHPTVEIADALFRLNRVLQRHGMEPLRSIQLGGVNDHMIIQGFPDSREHLQWIYSQKLGEHLRNKKVSRETFAVSKKVSCSSFVCV